MWILRTRPNTQARLRLLCFPYAGAGASLYSGWHSEFPTDLEVCAVQLPGRENRIGEQPWTQIEPMVRAITEELVPLLDKPIALFGHSLGALLSFEIARCLQTLGVIPLRVFVSAHQAPQLPAATSSWHTFSDADLFRHLYNLGGTSEDVLGNEELMDLILPTFRADLSLDETYTYKPGEPLASPISIFAGRDDTTVTFADLVPWAACTVSSHSTQVFPGGHFFLASAQQQVTTTIWHQLLTDLSAQPIAGKEDL